MKAAEHKRNRIEQVLREKGKGVSIHEVRSALASEFKVHGHNYYPIRRMVFGIKKKLKRTSTRMLKSELSKGIAVLKHKAVAQPLEHKVSFEDLRQVKDIADRVGGINQLVSIVGLMAELAS